MTRTAHGIIRHNTVILDEAVPEMEGHRVEVELREVALPEEEVALAPDLANAWAAWAQSANQGPITDEPDGWPPA